MVVIQEIPQPVLYLFSGFFNELIIVEFEINKRIMDQQKQTVREYFRSSDMVFYALLAGQVMFALVILGLLLSGDSIMSLEAEVFKILVVVIIMVCAASVTASIKVYKFKIQAISALAPISEKLAAFRSACIIRWALLEFPSFLSTLAAFITGSVIFIGIAGCVMVYFYTIKPNPEKTASDLNLGMEEKMIITNPESII